MVALQILDLRKRKCALHDLIMLEFTKMQEHESGKNNLQSAPVAHYKQEKSVRLIKLIVTEEDSPNFACSLASVITKEFQPPANQLPVLAIAECCTETPLSM